MVLWEVTLATAYFLGLRRTYRLALKMQRRIISPKHPKFRQFAHRRTRAIFDVALRVHRSIQERDIEVGRNLGNSILRWLDRMKPSANIRGVPEEKLPRGNNLNTSATKQATNSHQKGHDNNQRFTTSSFERGSDRRLFSAARSGFPKSFPGIAMLMRSPRMGSTTQYRQLSSNVPEFLTPMYGRAGFEGFMRKDIMLLMLRNRSSHV